MSRTYVCEKSNYTKRHIINIKYQEGNKNSMLRRIYSKIIALIMVLIMSCNFVYADDIEEFEWDEYSKDDVYTLFETTEWGKYAQYMNVGDRAEKMAKVINIGPVLYQKYDAIVTECLNECSYDSKFDKSEYHPIIMAIICALEMNYSPVEGEEEDPQGVNNFYSMHYFGSSYRVNINNLVECKKLAVNNILYRFFQAEQTDIDGLSAPCIYHMNSSLKRAIDAVLLGTGFMNYQVDEDEKVDYQKYKTETYIQSNGLTHALAGFGDTVSYYYICSGPDSLSGNKTVDRARECLGLPYVWGATGPNSYDCSGLVGYALTGTHGRIGTTWTFMGWPRVSNPQPGDICTNEGHCGVYIGDGQMIHAADYGIGVIIGPVQSGMIYVRYPY